MSNQYDELVENLKKLESVLGRIAEQPLLPATVVNVTKEDVLLASQQGKFVVKQTHLKYDGKNLQPGQSILIDKGTSQYVRDNAFPNTGIEVLISKVDEEEDSATALINGEPITLPLVEDLKVGDKVVLDEYRSFIMRIRPRNEDYSVPETGICWDDIGGNHEAKQAMIEAIENPHIYSDLYQFYGANGAKGILLFGPPGCGKTMLGKAAATSIGSADGFIYCKGPEVLDPYVGVAEQTVRGLFDRARRFHADTGRRAVIFIDEAEAILGRRGGRYSFMEKTIVPTFLAEMDGVEDSGAIVMLATNQSMALDPAVVRDGRIDRKIEIRRPNRDESREIVLTHLRKVPVNIAKEELADHIVKTTWDISFEYRGALHLLHNYVSGALFAGIVEKAKSSAMRRDISNNTRSGITVEDVDAALQLTAQEIGATSLEEL